MKLLRFAGALVGEIHDPFESDGTWYGTFRATLNGTTSEVSKFVEFCQDWIKRNEESNGDGDVAEFDQYAAFQSPGQWSLEDESGHSKIIGTPMFLDGAVGEITWVSEPFQY
jgi:hypothetical protein